MFAVAVIVFVAGVLKLFVVPVVVPPIVLFIVRFAVFVVVHIPLLHVVPMLHCMQFVSVVDCVVVHIPCVHCGVFSVVALHLYVRSSEHSV